MLGVLLMAVGLLVFLIGQIVIIIQALEDNIVKGLLCIFLIPYALYYLVFQGEGKARKLAILLMLAGVLLASVGFATFRSRSEIRPAQTVSSLSKPVCQA